MHNTSAPLVTSGARRGCGYRQPGGAYFAVPLGPGGRPVEEFLIDPPVVINEPVRLGLASVGVALIERVGVHHVIDVVGREHYPTVASFVEEARRLGVSRRAPRTIDFSRITSASRLLLAHAHADIANAVEFLNDARCPCHVPEHLAAGFAEMCARLWWEEPLEAAQHRSRCSPASRSRRSRWSRTMPAEAKHGGDGLGGRRAGGGGEAVSGQLSLLPTGAPELRRESVPLELIDGFEAAQPSAKLRELIRDLGLLQPVVVVRTERERYRLIEGRRRCKAIAQLAEAGECPPPACVDALVLDGHGSRRTEVRGGLTLALHASRSASPASELQAIEAILETATDAEEATTVKDIAAQTGISVQTVRRRLRLRSMTSGLRRGFDHGLITASLAEAAARLPDAEQQLLERKLDELGRLTLADVRSVAREQTSAASAALPGGLFTDHGLPWLATVRGHLTAALAAIPADQDQQPLRRVIAHALGRADEH